MAQGGGGGYAIYGAGWQDGAAFWAIVDSHGMANGATGQGWEDSLTQMQEWLIFTPANLKETNWEFLSAALEDARQ